jgi:hypothetical protein
MESIGFPLIMALPKGRTFNARFWRDNILAALTQLQPEGDGRKLVFTLTMQGLILLKNIKGFAKKMDCDSLSIHPTHLISPIRLLSVHLCQGTSQRNGISIIRGITRRNL